MQKHFFDPTFGGALVTGARNVFQTLDDISPFAFADAPRNWSPLISDFKLTPGGPLDFEQILEYDTQRGSGGQLITIGTLAKIKPYKDFFFTIADFRLDANPLVLQPKIKSDPHADRLRQRNAQGIQHYNRHQLRHHEQRAAKSIGAAELQRKLLRSRCRISPARTRAGSHRQSVSRRVHHRQHRHLRQSAPPGKDFLRARFRLVATTCCSCSDCALVAPSESTSVPIT